MSSNQVVMLDAGVLTIELTLDEAARVLCFVDELRLIRERKAEPVEAPNVVPLRPRRPGTHEVAR